MYVQELGFAITKTIRSSLDNLKRRAGQKLIKYGNSGHAKPEDPIISASIALSLPAGAAMTPTLDTIQQAVVHASKHICSIASAVLLWGQDRSQGAATLDSHIAMLQANKELTRGMESLSTVINATKGLLDYGLSKFDTYAQLWKDSIDETLAAFTDTNPDLTMFTEAIQKYENMDIAIAAMADTMPFGSILLLTHDFKLALLSEYGAGVPQYVANISPLETTLSVLWLSFSYSIQIP